MNSLRVGFLALLALSSFGCKKDKEEEVKPAPPASASALVSAPAPKGRLADLKAMKTCTVSPLIHAAPGPKREVPSTGCLRVGLEYEAPPLNEGIDPVTGLRSGFDYDLISAVAYSMGIDHVDVIEQEHFEDLALTLENGTVDVIMGGQTVNPKLKAVAWTEPYYEYGLCMVVKQTSPAHWITELNGKKIGLYKGDLVPVEYVKKNLPSATIVERDDTGWFKILETGEADGIIYDYPFALAELKTARGLEIRQLNINDKPLGYVIGVRSDHPDLLAALNEKLKAFRASGAYTDLVKRYLSLKPSPSGTGAGKSTPKINAPAIGSGQRIYVVKSGDSLSSIALADPKIGSFDGWKQIWELNKSRVPDPNLITEGTQLQMP